jgi:hypothetical protein
MSSVRGLLEILRRTCTRQPFSDVFRHFQVHAGPMLCRGMRVDGAQSHASHAQLQPPLREARPVTGSSQNSVPLPRGARAFPLSRLPRIARDNGPRRQQSAPQPRAPQHPHAPTRVSSTTGAVAMEGGPHLVQAFQALRSLFTAFLVLLGLLDNSILHVHDTSQEPVNTTAPCACTESGQRRRPNVCVLPLIHVAGKGAHQNRPVFCGPLALGLRGLWRLGGGLGDIGGDQVKVGPSGGDNVAGRHRHAQNMISVAEHVS